MTYAILAEGVAKSFTLYHKNQPRSDSLRETLSGSLRILGRRLVPGRRGLDNTVLEREEFWALREVSFTIRPGEKVGIIGRNGAGKSTLLKILSRVLEPSSGRIRIRGRVASLLEVGTGFHPELTGRENIYFNGALLGMSKAEIRRKFDAIVDFAEVEKFLDTPVKHYSSGMYVRLGFAVAAHLDPEILIVDEILAVGDLRFQRKCLGRMEQIGQEGRTVLFVSHNMNSIVQLMDRSLLLDQGRLILDASPTECVDRYLELNRSDDGSPSLSAKVDWIQEVRFHWLKERQEPGFNQPLFFRFSFLSTLPTPPITITLGFLNTLGARVSTCKVQTPKLEAGRHEFGLIVREHRLTPGCYFVKLDLWTDYEHLLEHDGACHIELFAEEITDPLLLKSSFRGRDRLGCYGDMELRRFASTAERICDC
ncbi:MAG TPA: ABC transporter ATP-binding protein [Methylococcus sp.]|nr:ABC transporter ATP-binding protein [Methylococcus sp.]